MKAVAAERARPHNILGVKKDPNCSIMKTAAIDFRGEKFALSDEMKECFLKLSDMVPFVPRNESGNIDGTMLMQYVIDYILDLELQLDDVEACSSQMPPFSFTSSDKSPSREPLSEKSLENVSSHSQMPSSSHMSSDQALLRTLECEIRPPSK